MVRPQVNVSIKQIELHRYRKTIKNVFPCLKNSRTLLCGNSFFVWLIHQFKATIGIFGNLLIIILLMKRGLKSAVDILIINLSAADCLYCFGLPIWANEKGIKHHS